MFQFANNMIVNIENAKKSTEKFLGLISDFIKIAGPKSNI